MANLNSYSDLLLVFFKLTNQIRLYHWQTKKYSRHKATDKLLSELNDLIDNFVETLTGRLIIENNNSEFKIELLHKNNKITLMNFDDKNGSDFIKQIKEYLENDDFNLIIKDKTDLQSIRDDMLAAINRTGYMFSLK